ncbi:MAG TPA: methylated-DNA--[protein]-cysteine S-methyltransferase [Sedimentisphaerales bacterium]|nr:methylated-DNA--[protein]-cysteine S-methyltransferase [Sedimentisphaerales bacterium]
MQKVIKYTIFKTKWGYFGLAGTEHALCRTQLPGPKPEKIKSMLLKNFRHPQLDKTFLRTLQEQITAYFEGAYINFSRDVPLVLDGFSSFGISVLTACRTIEFGQMITYGQLAKKSGRPNASRAVGSTLAKNPLPLIIPCHRIIRSDGKLGGFSALGGVNLKKRLLLHEKTHHNS